MSGSGGPGPGLRRAPALVTVVMPTLVRSATIGEAIGGLAAQDYAGDWELVLAVNRAGAVAEAEAVLARVPGLRARAVDASAVAGVSAARNAGARAGGGELVAICDDDDVASPGWLAALVAASRAADIAGGWLDPAPLNPPFAHEWHRPRPRDRAPLALGWRPYAVGASFAIWRDVLDDLGGFDETWVAGCEEIELCWRAQRRGYRIGFAPDAVVAYRFRLGYRDLARQVYRYGRAEPRLYRSFRRDGLPRSSTAGALRLWLGIARRLPALLSKDPARKGAWIRLAAYRAGRLAGSIRHRNRFL